MEQETKQLLINTKAIMEVLHDKSNCEIHKMLLSDKIYETEELLK